MEPICLITDTHLGIYKSADLWHDIVLNLFKEVADYCDRNNVTKIIHLGDFFDNRRALNVKTLNYAHQIAKILENFECWFVRGNHDQYFKNEPFPHSLIVFKKYPNIHIVEESYIIDLDIPIGLVPWNEEFKHLDCFILMGHFDINGFKMNDGFIQRHGRWNQKDFRGFKLVLSGHFHMPNSDPNNHIYYLGSPFQQNFGDAGSKRGFYIFNPIDNGGDLDFIEFTGAPKYTIIDTEDMQLDEVKGNIVKVYFRKDYGTTRNNEIIDEIMIREPLLFYTNFTDAAVELTDDIIEEDVAEMKDTKEIIVDFLQKSEIPEGLELKTVISMFSNLIDNVMEDMK